ncbi:MAG TPA: RodZ domain-containing protein [Rudaea sp.]|nr:RodZ domain-containing protein [Rudaea sp.]
MSFFDSDVPPTMNSDNHNSDDEQVQCGDTSKLDALAIDAAPGATPDALPKEEASPAESALPEGNAETEISADEPQADALAEHMGQADEPLRYVEKTAVDVSESLGQRLRAAREARGWRGEDVAQRLKLPLSTIQALEGDCYDRIGHGIYLRSYVTKYLRLLDLPQVLAERALGQEVELPPLVTSGTISRPRYLFQRYSVSALYLILTGVIIVPAVLLAMRAGFEPNLAQITSLDAPEPAATAVSAPNAAATPAESANPSASAKPAETPLVASLAPFPPIAHESTEAEPSEKAAESTPPVQAPAAHGLRLKLAEESWVEVVAVDGEKLEYGLLPAGAVRTYASAKPIDVRLGNADGATVELNGKPQDLTAFRHGNIAHFKLAAGDTTLSHSGN